jgi:hypothetical protein
MLKAERATYRSASASSLSVSTGPLILLSEPEKSKLLPDGFLLSNGAKETTTADPGKNIKRFRLARMGSAAAHREGGHQPIQLIKHRERAEAPHGTAEAPS